MLRLVSDNTKKTKQTEEITCKTRCILYNDELNLCPLFRNLDYDDPNTVKRCLEFTDREQTEKLYDIDFDDTEVTLVDEEFNVQMDLNFLFELVGNRHNQNANYPLKPDISLEDKIQGLYWYVSPDKTYGCWIKNDSKIKLGTVPVNKETAKKGWAKNIYRSPVPLHDHQASDSLKSRMCWYVDEEGWGQYTVLIANEIKFITYPKPQKW